MAKLVKLMRGKWQEFIKNERLENRQMHLTLKYIDCEF